MKTILIALLLISAVSQARTKHDGLEGECIQKQSLPFFQPVQMMLKENMAVVQLDRNGTQFGMLLLKAPKKFNPADSLNPPPKPNNKIKLVSPQNLQLKSGEYIKVTTYKECEE